MFRQCLDRAWTAAGADAARGLSQSCRGALWYASVAACRWQDPRDLGWRADPSEPRGSPLEGKAFLASGAARRLHLERLPGYAPDLNPVELVWRYFKHVALRNVGCATLDDLRYELRLAIASMRHKRDTLYGLLKHCGYHV